MTLSYIKDRVFIFNKIEALVGNLIAIKILRPMKQVILYAY